MKTLYERMSELPIIKTKLAAERFARVCSGEDWTHTFSLNPNEQTKEGAWESRREINRLIKLELRAMSI